MNKKLNKAIRLALLAGLGAATLSGCAIRQNVRAIEQPLAQSEICIIEAQGVRAGFLQSLKRNLQDKGYTVRQLPTSAPVTECPITATYTANWRWDLAMYMAYAEIRVFGGGKQIGEAKYDAMGGSGSLAKFIEADKKIAELVNQLFPSGPALTAQN